MRHVRLPLVLSLLLPAALLTGPVSAQETVIPAENVRMDYAQVLRVEPVFQTLTATRMEPQCDSRAGDGKPAEPKPSAKGIARIVGAVRNALEPDDASPPPSADDPDCRVVPVEREFRRPIAFDVDYMYKGMKYRSRLSTDPGNRLRVRVSVTPYVPQAKR